MVKILKIGIPKKIPYNRELHYLKMNYRLRKSTFPLYVFQEASRLKFRETRQTIYAMLLFNYK